MGGVDVGVAQAGCLDPDEHLTGSRFGNGQLPEYEWFVEIGDYRGSHRLLLSGVVGCGVYGMTIDVRVRAARPW
jgi:hypothetical protein